MAADPQPTSRTYVQEDGLEERVSATGFVVLMRAVLDKGASFRFRALGDSMTPFIRDGDMLTIAPARSRAIGFGDVVAFKLRYPGGERLVVHRCVGQRDRLYHIQGDLAANLVKHIARPADLLGRVVLIERDGKRIRFGLGPERYLIAALSRFGLLPQVLRHRLDRWWARRGASRRRRP
jgi:hypothetical protein